MRLTDEQIAEFTYWAGTVSLGSLCIAGVAVVIAIASAAMRWAWGVVVG